MTVFWGLMIPLAGTTLGSACVFFLKDKLNELLQKGLLGFASGVMVAASVWSLLIPSMDMTAGMGRLAFVPAAAGMLSGSTGITAAGAFSLAIGIAIQNFPEGAIISMPLKSEGQMSRKKAFLYGTLSGAVEPVGAALTIALASVIDPFLPYLLSFAAGAMLYVVVEELIPEASEGEHSNLGTVGFAVGFVLMMVLDVALG